MTLLYSFILYPLISSSDIKFGRETSPKEVITLIVTFAAIFGVILIINLIRKSSTPAAGSGGGGGAVKTASGGGGGFFAMLAVHKMARNIGLNGEQIKMLDFVFKTDQVLEPEKSFVTPALLDRHFRRAYRVIQQPPDRTRMYNTGTLCFFPQEICWKAGFREAYPLPAS